MWLRSGIQSCNSQGKAASELWLVQKSPKDIASELKLSGCNDTGQAVDKQPFKEAKTKVSHKVAEVTHVYSGMGMTDRFAAVNGEYSQVTM